MHIQFLGGASTVTGSRHLVTTKRAKILIDCGMFQGSPNETIRNRVPLGMDPSELDAILVTHAHLDHCGLLPLVVKEGFDGPIYLTSATAELVEIVLLDSGRLQEEFAKRHTRWERRHPADADSADAKAEAQYQAALEEARRAEEEGHVPTSIEPAGPDDAGQLDPDATPDPTHPTAPLSDPAAAAANTATSSDPDVPDVGSSPVVNPPLAHNANPEVALRNQPPVVEADLDAPLYDEDDAKLVMPLFKDVRYGKPIEVAPGIIATFDDAGHILGSAIIRLEIREEEHGGPVTTIVFSGDLGRPGTPIIRDPTPETGADYVVCESTYGGREHEPEAEAIQMLGEVVRATHDAGGVLLIPSFAIGRTQEVVWQLDRLIDEHKIPMLPLYLDSPMAQKASDIYRRHPEFYDEQTAKLLREGDTPLDYPHQTITKSMDDSKAIEHAARPYMIVASNGMLTGGRVVSHLRNLIDDPKATILFVGYQGVGTLGAHLQQGARTVKLDGQVRQVRCRVRSISGFSAHADESELLDWLRHFTDGRAKGSPGYPRTVFLVHGDPEAQVAIAPKVQALGFEVHVPTWREQVELT
ncbi:MAG TPA: MBL fold metallo-hydrolase [Candidatus Limnocylindrales bacterium]|nr:MBL fold metallo-hydrolase [Candidatus Limnocylindrales bacterium]